MEAQPDKNELECAIRRSHSAAARVVEESELQSWQLAAAQAILEVDDSNLIALTIVADSYLQSGRDPQRLIVYARKILAVLDDQPEQEGFSSVEWLRKKTELKGRAYWMISSARGADRLAVGVAAAK